MNDALELTLHERLQALEERSTLQQAQIDALRCALSGILVAHAMQTDDARPIVFVRECCDANYHAAKSGGTKRVPETVLAGRSDALAEILQEISVSDLCSRYWQRSAIGFLDERRYQEMMRKAERIHAISAI